MRTLVIHPKDKTTDFLKPIYYGRDYTVITGDCTKQDVADAIDKHDHIIMMGHGTPQGLLAVGQFDGKPKLSKKHYATQPKPSTAIRKDGPVTAAAVKSYYGGKQKQTLPKTQSLLDELPDKDDYLDEDSWYSNRKVGSGSYGSYGGYGGGYTGYNSTYESLRTGYVIDDSNADQLRDKKVTAIWCNADQYMEWNNLSGFYTGMFISDTSEAAMIGTADHEQWQIDESNYGFAALVRNLIEYPAVETLKHLKIGYGKMAKRNAIAKYNYRRLYVRKAKDAEVVAVNE